MFINVTRQELFDRISQEDIMDRYFGEAIKVGKKYKNPFRHQLGIKADSTPGCYFSYSANGRLLFYDYATEKKFFDCVDIAELATGIKKPEIYNAIWNNLKATYSSPPRHIISTPRERKDIRVELDFFNQQDLDFWGEGNISPEILSYFNVRKVRRAWIDGYLWRVSTPKSPIYRYRQKDQFKLYLPFEKKENKFRNNYNKGFLDGWEQLPLRGDKVYLVKAMKDCMTLYSLGITSVGVLSENTLVSDNALELLGGRFDEIIPWMDNDEAGLLMIEKYKQIGLIGITNPIDKPKDPFDWAKSNINELKEFLCLGDL